MAPASIAPTIITAIGVAYGLSFFFLLFYLQDFCFPCFYLLSNSRLAMPIITFNTLKYNTYYYLMRQSTNLLIMFFNFDSLFQFCDFALSISLAIAHIRVIKHIFNNCIFVRTNVWQRGTSIRLTVGEKPKFFLKC